MFSGRDSTRIMLGGLQRFSNASNWWGKGGWIPPPQVLRLGLSGFGLRTFGTRLCPPVMVRTSESPKLEPYGLGHMAPNLESNYRSTSPWHETQIKLALLIQEPLPYTS